MDHRHPPDRFLGDPDPPLPARPVVDAHVHVFPPRVFAAIRTWFAAHAWPLRYQAEADELLVDLARRGVERAWGLHYAHTPGLARVLNRFARELADRHPLLVPFGTVLPGEPDAVAVVEEALEDLGLRGLKLHCHVQRLAPDDPRLDPILEIAADRGVPVVLHAGREPFDEAYGFDTRAHCGVRPVRRVLERHPRLTLVVPHLGQDEWREFLALARDAPGLYLDTAMAVGGYLTGDGPGREDLLAIHDRVLFGTDYPNLPYPWGRELRWLLDLGLPPAAEEAILRGNALRLVGEA